MNDLIWLSHFVPYPARGGAAQRSYNLMRQAARHYRVSLFAFNRPQRSPEALDTCRREFERFCHRVEYLELPFAWKGFSWWSRLLLSPLAAYPMAVLAYGSDRMNQRWRQFLAEYDRALVHVDSSDLALFIDPACKFPVVLNHHNCESAMMLRRAQQETNPLARWVLRRQAVKQEALERDLLHNVAVNLTVSDEDAHVLRLANPDALFRVVENGTDTDFFTPDGETGDEKTIVFAGSLNWYPNVSGLSHFSSVVWPTLKARCPGIRFIVAGQDPPKCLLAWAKSDPQVQLVANPEDIRPWIACGTVFVCPVIDGGGSRLKLLDAMAMGKAVVTTTIGAEGLRVTPGVHMMIVDSAQQFANQVLWLLDNSGIRTSIGIAARKWVVEEYSWPVIGERLISVYAEASGNPRTESTRRDHSDTALTT